MKPIIIHNIGWFSCPNYTSRNALRNFLKNNTCLITVDGVYKNVFSNKDLFEKRHTILFITGDYVGKDNSFNPGKALEQMCDWNEVMEMARMGCKLGWHSWSHRDLTKLSDEELRKEVAPPFPMKYFAYPYGIFDDKVIEAVKRAGYEEAFGVTVGDDSRFQRLRKYV